MIKERLSRQVAGRQQADRNGRAVSSREGLGSPVDSGAVHLGVLQGI